MITWRFVWNQNMETHFKLYTAVLAERSEPLVQCIFINDSLLNLHFLKPLELVQSFACVSKQCPVVLMETISYYSLYNLSSHVGYNHPSVLMSLLPRLCSSPYCRNAFPQPSVSVFVKWWSMMECRKADDQRPQAKKTLENLKKKKKDSIISSLSWSVAALLAWRTILNASLNVNYGCRILTGSLHMSLFCIPVSMRFAAPSKAVPFWRLMDGRHISQPGTR